MRSLAELIAVRKNQLTRIRKAQMAIAVIDATITTDPRYVDLLNEWDGDVETEIPDPRALEENPFASSN